MKIDILVYPGVDELDCIAPLEVLKNAQEFGADFEVRLVSLYSCLTITASHGLNFEAKCQFEPGKQDMIIVPGGSWLSRKKSGAYAEYRKGNILEKLQKAQSENSSLCFGAVCTGSMLLAHAGIIGARIATTHHSCWNELENLGFQVSKDRVVDSGSLITAGGVTSGIDLALHVTARFASKEIALKIQDLMEYKAWYPAQ